MPSILTTTSLTFCYKGAKVSPNSESKLVTLTLLAIHIHHNFTNRKNIVESAKKLTTTLTYLKQQPQECVDKLLMIVWTGSIIVQCT